jgi:hypothetical protein
MDGILGKLLGFLSWRRFKESIMLCHFEPFDPSFDRLRIKLRASG